LNKAINTQKIEELFEGAEDELATFVEVMFGQFEEYKKELEQAFLLRNLQTLKDLRHKIKSICLSFDIPFLLEGLKELIDMLEDPNQKPEAWEAQLNALLLTMNEVQTELKSFQHKA
jgi:molybdopterin converting factor small subunit